MAKYAEGTTVSIETSQMEIKRALVKYGATGFMLGESDRLAQIEFEMHGRRVRFRLTYPDPQDREFVYRSQYIRRTDAERRNRYEAEKRRLWRALLLTIKSKLEAVQNGLVSFEEEMLPFIVLPDNRTVGQWLVPQIATAYDTGRMPPLLGPGGA